MKYSNDHLQTTRVAKADHVRVGDVANAPFDPAAVDPRGVEHASHVAGKPGFARAGAAKHPSVSAPPTPHGGMHSSTREGTFVGGKTQTTVASGAGASPTTPLVEKTRAAPKAAWGMRSGDGTDLDHELGARILREARRT